MPPKSRLPPPWRLYPLWTLNPAPGHSVLKWFGFCVVPQGSDEGRAAGLLSIHGPPQRPVSPWARTRARSHGAPSTQLPWGWGGTLAGEEPCPKDSWCPRQPLHSSSGASIASLLESVPLGRIPFKEKQLCFLILRREKAWTGIIHVLSKDTWLLKLNSSYTGKQQNYQSGTCYQGVLKSWQFYL